MSAVRPEHWQPSSDHRTDAPRFRVLDASAPQDFADWMKAWNGWPQREAMARPEYVRLFARPCDRVVAALSESGGGGVLFPLILRPLAVEPWARPGEQRWDATSPYGYGGPFAWGIRPPEDATFWGAYSEWCQRERIVTTFARLSLFPEQLAFIPGPVEERGQNIVVSLEPGVETVWRSYSPSVRQRVLAAERAALKVEMDPTGARLDEFIAIYSHTMKRNNAEEWYFFPRAFFQAIVDGLSGHFVFVHADHEGRMVSSGLVLCAQEHVYSYLSGTFADALRLAPSYLLNHRIIEWAAAAGKKAYVLGGGYEPGDGIFQYKRAFARRGAVPFKVACLTHDERARRELLRDRSDYENGRETSWSPRAAFFPEYRA